MLSLQSNSHFYLHVCFFKIRDFFYPRLNVLKEIGINPDFQVVDYGCGPGSYIISLSMMVGKNGKVFAVDSHPLAVKKVREIISRKGLNNVEAVCSDCETGLSGNSIDIVLLYDVFHALQNPDAVLVELHRIIKPGGILSFQDHRIEGKTIPDIFIKSRFRLLEKGQRAYSYQKIV